MSTRKRIFMWWVGHFSSGYVTVVADMSKAFWGEIHDMMRLRLGTFQLCGERPKSQADDAAQYLLKCPGEQFLDFIEDLFRTKFYEQMQLDNDQKVKELNELLRVDKLSYYVTNFVPGYGETEIRGQMRETFFIAEYPKVVMRESEVVHAHAMVPALFLLQNPAFATANKEFLAALEDYRKGDYGDSLTKCGSSFESLMKILCDKKGWPYKQTDTVGPLIKTILANTMLIAV